MGFKNISGCCLLWWGETNHMELVYPSDILVFLLAQHFLAAAPKACGRRSPEQTLPMDQSSSSCRAQRALQLPCHLCQATTSSYSTGYPWAGWVLWLLPTSLFKESVIFIFTWFKSNHHLSGTWVTGMQLFIRHIDVYMNVCAEENNVGSLENPSWTFFSWFYSIF